MICLLDKPAKLIYIDREEEEENFQQLFNYLTDLSVLHLFIIVSELKLAGVLVSETYKVSRESKRLKISIN